MIIKLAKTLITTIISITMIGMININAQASIGELTMINAIANVQVSGAYSLPKDFVQYKKSFT